MSDEEVVDGIAWTPALRELVIPSRRIANPPALANHARRWRIGIPLDPEAARRAASYPETHHSRQASVERTARRWQPAVATALAQIGKPPATEPELDVEIALTVFELRPLYVSLPYWISAGSVAFALRVLIGCHAVSIDGNSKTKFLVEDRTGSEQLANSHHDAWRFLRTVLASAVEPIYDEAHGIADAARLAESKRAPGETGLLPMLAYAFPDEPRWAEQAAPHARALLAAAHKRTKKMWGNRTFSTALARFIAVAPVDTAVAMLTEATNTAVDEADLVTALAHHGAAGGAAIYQAALAHTATNDAQRKQWCAQLVAIRTQDGRRVLSRLAKRQHGKRVFTAALAQHRRLVT